MSIGGAFRDGFGRVQRAPALLAGLWMMTFLLAWPLALTLRGMLADHLGSSVAAGAAADGVNFDWWNEFLAQAAGIGQTFVPAILGFAAVLKNLSSIADATPVPIVIASAITAHVVVSIFLLGGVLDRLARDRRVGSYGFFSACGIFFFRLLRLALIAGAVYWLLFAWLHPLLFDTLYSKWTHNVTVERTAFFYRAGLYLLFAIVLLLVNVYVDYTKIRLVVEDRRSVLGALAAAARFIARQPGAILGLYGLNLLIFLVVLAIYAVIAPGASGGVALWIGFLIGQLYIVLRVAVRLLFAASQIALFQGRLAHAGYSAVRVATWPESPLAEAIRPE